MSHENHLPLFLTWTLPRVIVESRVWRAASRVLGVTLAPLNSSYVSFIVNLMVVSFLLPVLYSVGHALDWWTLKEFLVGLAFLLTLPMLAGLMLWVEERYTESRRNAAEALEDALTEQNGVSKEEMKQWVDVPLPLSRKILLAEAGIPVSEIRSPETLAFTDEDLAIMAALLD